MDAKAIDAAVRGVLMDAWDVSADEIVLDGLRSDGALSFAEARAAVEGSEAMECAASAVEPVEMFSISVLEPRPAVVSVFFDARGALVAASLFGDHDV